MKFFHVYNDDCFVGLEKNGLINKDTGFKIQHCFAVPEERKFNRYAAKGGKLYNLLKENNIPFYVDRIAGGITFHHYDFDKALIREYVDMLGDWFLGFQLHESGSNRRNSDWQRVLRLMDGKRGPYSAEDAAKVRAQCMRNYAKLPDGTVLEGFSQDSSAVYMSRKYAETPKEYIDEMKDLFHRRMLDVDGRILPCDSFFMATKLQDEIGMRTFMPEVGCQIPMMRVAVALARGLAKASGKTWGTYYECWRVCDVEGSPGEYFCTMPVFNADPVNEWYLTQETHLDDFTTHGKNGGSSRLLQDRIYYFSLMAGADYLAEEWGLNCSYSDMKDFTLSEYGILKKNFINKALTLRGMKAKVPFALVLPKDYACVEIPEVNDVYEYGIKRDVYMRCDLSAAEKDYYGHIENVIKLIFARTEKIGNEGHVLTNSRFGDVFDIIYEDASVEALARYDYLIDATEEGRFLQAKKGGGLKVLASTDLDNLEKELQALIRETMPCYVDGLCWLVSSDENNAQYVSIFNNEGNERCLKRGNVIHHEADKTVQVTFKQSAKLEVVAQGAEAVCIEKKDDLTYHITVPAASFAVIKF